VRPERRVVALVRPQEEILSGWWNLDPFRPTLGNFVNALSNPDNPMWRGLRNSAIVAVPATLIPMFVASFAAYGFARYRFPFRDYVFLAIVLLMAIPQQMVAVPLFLRLLDAGLLDQFLGLVLVPHEAFEDGTDERGSRRPLLRGDRIEDVDEVVGELDERLAAGHYHMISISSRTTASSDRRCLTRDTLGA